MIIDNDSDGLYSNTDIYHHQQKCLYLFHCLNLIVENYHQHTITKCINDALSKINDFQSSPEIDDLNDVFTAKTILKWYKNFKQHNAFQNAKKPNGKSVLPTLLQANPEIKKL